MCRQKINIFSYILLYLFGIQFKIIIGIFSWIVFRGRSGTSYHFLEYPDPKEGHRKEPGNLRNDQQQRESKNVLFAFLAIFSSMYPDS